MSVDALEAQGTVVTMSDGASPEVYTAIGEITTVGGPDGSASEIDVTDLASTSKEFKMGINDEGSVTLELLFRPKNTQHAALRTAKKNRTLSNFQLQFTDSPQTQWAFSAYVTGLSVSLSVDAATTGSVTLRITGDITET